MIAIEIIMLIIGIAAVIASFRLSDEKETDNTKSNIDAEELEEKIKDAVKETEDYIITKADEKFSQISNDKIMGFNEYSKEVFDKIEKNRRRSCRSHSQRRCFRESPRNTAGRRRDEQSAKGLHRQTGTDICRVGQQTIISSKSGTVQRRRR